MVVGLIGTLRGAARVLEALTAESQAGWQYTRESEGAGFGALPFCLVTNLARCRLYRPPFGTKVTKKRRIAAPFVRFWETQRPPVSASALFYVPS
jgi:hypothetical protein